MSPIVIHLPPPHKLLNPNKQPRTRRAINGMHAEARKHREAGRIAGLVALQQSRMQPPKLDFCKVDVRFVRSTARGRPPDRDNILAWSKHGIDGALTDTGIVSDDSVVRWGTIESEVDRFKTGVWLTVTRR